MHPSRRLWRVWLAVCLLLPVRALAQTAFVSDFTPNGEQLYMLDLEDVSRRIAIPEVFNAYKVAITPDGETAVVIRHFVAPNVLLIDTTTLEVTPIPPPTPADQYSWPSGIAIVRNGTTAYISDFGRGKIYPIDLQRKLALPPINGFDNAYSVALSADNRSLYVTQAAPSNRLVQINLANQQVMRSLPVNDPGEIALSPISSIAYIVDQPTSFQITQIDLNHWAVLSNLAPAGGQHPANAAISHDGKDLYLVGYSNDISRIEIATGHVLVTRTFNDPAPGDRRERPINVAVSPDGESVYVGYANRIIKMDAKTLATTLESPVFQNVRLLSVEPPKYQSRVYFIGDSVTAGFGYCGQESALVNNCAVNSTFSDAWVGGGVLWSLGYCAPGNVPDDRCSNNNAAGGPWTAGPWVAGDALPKVAYSYAIAGLQSPKQPAQIFNWAVTGSTPSHWDAVTIGQPRANENPGLFANHLGDIHNSYVVMTLGANPILNDYLHVDINALGLPIPAALTALLNGPCASTTVQNGKAATLDATDTGVAKCLDGKWAEYNQTQHLTNIYARLLNQGNRVLVVGYPPVCPWSFGDWQPAPNPLGPSRGKSCALNPLPQVNPQSGGPITQADQAFYLGSHANDLIRLAVESMNNPDIVYVPPAADWTQHQAWAPDGQSWVFGNDTWVHPSRLGHEQIAYSVLGAMCQSFGHWCPDSNRAPQWPLP